MTKKPLFWPLPQLFPELNRFDTVQHARKAHARAMLRSGLGVLLPIVIAGAPFVLLLDPPSKYIWWLFFPTWIALPWGITYLFRARIRRYLRKELAESGVPICVKCGYDLRGQSAPRCPECGTPFDEQLFNCEREKSAYEAEQE